MIEYVNNYMKCAEQIKNAIISGLFTFPETIQKSHCPSVRGSDNKIKQKLLKILLQSLFRDDSKGDVEGIKPSKTITLIWYL